MPAATVPPDEFMKQADDHSGGFTVRRPIIGVEGTPSFPLEEAVSATALRFAKEKFQARPWQEDDRAMARVSTWARSTVSRGQPSRPPTASSVANFRT